MATLITVFASNGHLGFRETLNGNLEMDLEKSIVWLAHIHQAWKELCCLIHISYGPSFCGVEEILFQIMNMASSWRHLFIHQNDLASHDSPNCEMIAIVTNYDKTESLILVEKKNIKMIPYRISRILIILLLLIHPLEQLLVCRFISLHEHHPAVLSKYSQGSKIAIYEG